MTKVNPKFRIGDIVKFSKESTFTELLVESDDDPSEMSKVKVQMRIKDTQFKVERMLPATNPTSKSPTWVYNLRPWYVPNTAIIDPLIFNSTFFPEDLLIHVGPISGAED